MKVMTFINRHSPIKADKRDVVLTLFNYEYRAPPDDRQVT